MGWVINASSVLKKRAELMELKEGLTYEWGDEKHSESLLRRGLTMGADANPIFAEPRAHSQHIS